MTMAYMLWLREAGKRSEWYNSMLCFPAGMWYCLMKDNIEKLLFHSFPAYLAVLLCAIVLYAYTYQKRGSYYPCELKNYSLWILIFTGCVLLLSMKVSFESPLLKWFGDHVFSIYILQRLPMIILYESGLMENYYYEGLILTIVATILLAIGFEKARDKIFSYIWRNRQIFSHIKTTERQSGIRQENQSISVVDATPRNESTASHMAFQNASSVSQKQLE